MKILFICKHNRFRSQVAQAIFNKLNKDRNNSAESAGLVLHDNEAYVEPIVIQLMKEKGYIIPENTKPRQATSELVKNFDIIVIVADNVSPEFFHDFKGKILHWKIKDVSSLDESGIIDRIEKIEKKVKNLLKGSKSKSS